ncbi:winged helix-turn-helix domain-containing protein [Photobacterium sp. 1_MG-2023]|uniref:winged helix-turn-helix domain-containing protein n=1 Tax=Photobacterium sp. 1_MG-2023 TaxID=3062646 RepID=UPI0026E2F944|nr:winged helix-turn-helix domain-containing protein [Photobacterium sp. 1_MG-2023]MDO6705047.1 winged helix-turn-helix domain-containing protein [Photobacterium sp. 1_MG-2023]
MDQAQCKFLIGNRFLFTPHHNSLVDKTQSDTTIHLGINESKALSLLVQEPGTIISRQRMHDFIWREQGFEVDDSSLTQAISTLRKYLQDSTRAPMFIKTVPKHGYQMIADIDRLDAITESDSVKTSEPDQIEVIERQSESAPPPLPSNPAVQTSPTQAISPLQWHRRHMISGLAALLLCLLLPLWAYFTPPPTSSAFYPAFTVGKTPVLIPSHDQIPESWYPLIRQCLAPYEQQASDKPLPIKAVVTGGEHNQLWINLIFSPSAYQNNMTLTIVTLNRHKEQPCRIR